MKLTGLLDRLGSTMALPALAAARRRQQWLSAEELARVREQQLSGLLQTAFRAPYYREVFRSLGVRDAREAGRLTLAQLPLLERETLKTRPIEDFLTVDRSRLFASTTSGSTGSPCTFLRSPLEQADFSARWWRVYAAYGCGWNSTQVNIASGMRKRLPGALTVLRDLGLLPKVQVYPASAPAERICEAVEALAPPILTGYSAAIESFAEHVIASGVRLPRPRVVICTGMEVLQRCRKLARQAFGAPVADVYVTLELGVVAWSCPQSPDLLHINDDVFEVEVLDADGRPAAYGVSGELVITPLRLRSMPLLRYRIGDVAARVPGKCPCGRGLALMTPVQGRTAHAIRAPNGGLIMAPTFGASFEMAAAGEWARRFQIREESEGRIAILVEARREPTDAEQERLRRCVQQLVGSAFDVSLKITESIPYAPSGKFQVVVPRRERVA